MMRVSQLTVTGVDFVALPAQDLDRAVGFYRDVLGLRITADHRDKNVDWVEFDAGGTCIGLVIPESFGGQFQAVKFAGVGLRVNDVQATLADLKARGLEVHHEDTGICHMIFVEDSEGNNVCLHNRYAPED